MPKNYSHTIPAKRVFQKYKSSAPTVPTAPPVAAGIVLTTGSVPQNLRCLTAGDALPGGGTAQDGTFVWDGTPTTTALGTLVRYEMRAYLRPATPDAHIPAGTSLWVCPVANDDHQPEWTVQAVYRDAMGMETASRQSNICTRITKLSPVPDYYPTALPSPPKWVTGRAFWNEGKPLNYIEWGSSAEAQAFRIDDQATGKTLADGLYVLEYTDHDLQPGQTRTYLIYKAIPVRTPTVYSPPVSVTVTALSAQPAVTLPAPANPVVYGYPGSAIIEVDAPYAYGDLRAYGANPDQVKFAGQNPAPNGAPVQNRPRIALQYDVPPGGIDLTLNFVDKPAPFQPMNTNLAQDQASGMAGMPKSVNGQGPPCFVPTPVSAPLVLHLDGLPSPDCCMLVKGDPARAISLDFHNQVDFNPGPEIARSAMTPEWQTVFDYCTQAPEGSPPDFGLQESPTLWFAKYNMNKGDSNFFDMANHGMSWAVEGGGPGSGPAHQANGANLMQMKQGFQLRPGEIGRFVVLGDNHISGREWRDLFIKELFDPFLRPGKFAEFNRRPTGSGNLYRAEFTTNRTSAVYYPPDSPYQGTTSDDRSQSTAPNYKTNLLTSVPNDVGLADFFFDIAQELEITIQYRASDGACKVRSRARTQFTNDLTRQGGGANRGGYDGANTHDFDANVVFPWWQRPDAWLVFAMEQLKYHSAIDGREEGMNSFEHRRMDMNRNVFKSEWHVHGMLVDITPVPAGQTMAPWPV